MIIYDIDTLKIQAVNRAAIIQYGYTRREFSRLTLKHLRPPQELPQLLSIMPSLKSTTMRVSGVWTHCTKDGRLIQAHITSQPITFKGKPMRVSTVIDVTTRLRAERELRESEMRFRQLAETIDEVFWIRDPAINTVLYISPSFLKIWGIPSEMLYSDPHFFIDSVHPDDRQRILDAAPKQMAGTFDEQYRIVRPDGTVRWIRDRAYPVRDSSGVIYRIVGIADDITAQKQTEDALRASEASLAEAQRLAHLGSWEFDLQTHTHRNHSALRWSAEVYRMFGYEPNAVTVNYPLFYNHVHPEDRERVRQTLNLAIVNKKADTMEYRIRRADGKERYVRARIELLLDDHEKPLRLLGTVLDITESKQLEQQFLHAQKMESIGRLAGGVAHDFNNILTVVKSYSDLLAHRLAGDSDNARDIEEIRKAVRQATALTQRLLAFSRKQTLQPRVLQLNHVITDMEVLLRRLLGENVQLRTHLDPVLGPVRMDPGHIEQIVMNLAINARDAMPNGGVLTVETMAMSCRDTSLLKGAELPAGSWSILTITDTGCGMDRETRDHLFEPFFTTKPQGQGTGLGLATVYGIVQQCGGRIMVESAPNHGSTFRLYIPSVTEALTPSDESRLKVAATFP